MSKNKADEVKKAFEYAGEIVDISSLMGLTNIPLEVIDTNPAVIQDKWGITSTTHLPKLIILRTLEKSYLGDKSKSLRYMAYNDNFRSNYVYIPNTLKVKKLSGKQATTMLEKHKQYIFANLGSHLSTVMTIGSDPEIFVEDNGVVLPAFNFLGSKAIPNRSKRHSYGGLPVYWDGFQAEFETSPQECLAWQVDSVQYGLSEVYRAAKTICPNAKLSSKTVMGIPNDMLQNSKEEFVTFGCMPSENIYGLKGKMVPPRDLPFRSAGGHIHFGIGKLSPTETQEVVKSLDAILGVSCVSLFASFDNPARREFYGLPGEYRLPAHGLEYRVLSNAWLFHPLIMNIVFDLSRKAVAFGMNNLREFWKATEEETINIIRDCDVEKARVVMDRNSDILKKLLRACYGLDGAYDIFMNGMESAIKDPTDIVGNWNLNTHWTDHSDGYGKNFGKARDALNNGKKV